MAKRNYAKTKGRGNGKFLLLPHSTINNPNFRSLSGSATKLLIDMSELYNGSNNGNFSTAAKLMRSRGWKSNDTVGRAQRELEDKGFLLRTRQGGRTQCSLFAITWWPIDECGGRLEILPTKVAPNNWKNRICTPDSGAD